MLKYFLLFPTIVCPFVVHTQTFLDTLSVSLNNYLHYFPEEKIYIQFDKSKYQPNDNAWFKCYITNNGKESSLSKIAYFELLDSSGTILKRLTLPVLNSGAYGNFKIPKNKHILYLRAYTAWMLNFGKENLYYKKIIVGNADDYHENKIQTFFANFFPEGGSIVKGLKSKIVCKTFLINGFPIKATVKIIDASENVIANIKTNENGFGEFMFTPTDTIKYKAQITLENGLKKTFELPKVNNEGITFYLKNNFNPKGNQLSFYIARSDVNKNDYQNLVICSQLNEHVQFNKVDLNQDFPNTNNDTNITSTIPLDLFNFSSGILHLSVFSSKTKKLLAERLSNYNNGNEITNASIFADTINFNAHALNVFTLKLPQSSKGNLSISITSLHDTNKINTNFLSSEFLTSNFNNYINSPAHYYEDDSIETQQALDDLLITQKQQNFSWSKILQDSFPVIIYQPEKSLSFSGKVLVVKDNKTHAFSNRNFLLAVKTFQDSNLSVFKIKTDTTGRFNLSNLDFYDTALFYIQTYDTGDKLTLTGDRYFTDSIYSAGFYDKEEPERIDTNTMTITQKIIHPHFYIQDTSGATLKPVTVRTKIISHTDSTVAHFCHGPFIVSLPLKDFDFTNDSTHAFDFENVYEFIESHFIKERGADYYLNEQLLSGEFGQQILSETFIRDVALIRVFYPHHFPAAPKNAPSGAVAVYLKDGTEKRYNSFFKSFLKKGYTQVDSFSNTEKLNNDQNSETVYWNPNLIEDSLTHSCKIRFYNPVTSKCFNIIVEGIDKNGNLLHKEFLLKKEE